MFGETCERLRDLILAPVNFNGIMTRSRKAEWDSPSYSYLNPPHRSTVYPLTLECSDLTQFDWLLNPKTNTFDGFLIVGPGTLEATLQ